METFCIKLYCIFTKEKTARWNVLRTSVTQKVKLGYVSYDAEWFNNRTRDDKNGGVWIMQLPLNTPLFISCF